MEAIQLEYGPGIGRPPANRQTLVIPRKNAAAIRFQETLGAQIAADRHQAGRIGSLRITP